MTYDGAWACSYHLYFRFLVWHRIEMQLTFLELLSDIRFSCSVLSDTNEMYNMMSSCCIFHLIGQFSLPPPNAVFLVMYINCRFGYCCRSCCLQFLCVCWRPFVPIVVLMMLSFWLLWDCWVVLYFCGVRSSRLTFIFKRSGDGGLLLWIQV